MCIREKHMVRTSFDFDEGIVEEARKLSGAPSKKAAIEVALREYISMKRRQEFADAIMRGEFNINLTPAQLKKMRKPRASLDVPD